MNSFSLVIGASLIVLPDMRKGFGSSVKSLKFFYEPEIIESNNDILMLS